MVAAGAGACKATGDLAVQRDLIPLQREYGANLLYSCQEPVFTGFVLGHSSHDELDQAHQFREPKASHMSL